MGKIAIDGPVASGKTVVGKRVATCLGYRFLDTGIMYRALTWVALNQGVSLNNHEALVALSLSLKMELVAGEPYDRLHVDELDVTDFLRTREVDQSVSELAAVSGVRSALVDMQRSIADNNSIVMVGRDIGTVVLPGADVKVFLKASFELRVQRRYSELQGNGASISYRQVSVDLDRRDNIDIGRLTSPLRPAYDAALIDTDNLSVVEIVEIILRMANGHL